MSRNNDIYRGSLNKLHVGIGQLTTEGFRIRQFFLRDLAAEGALLTALVPIFRQASALVTYNGKLFDAALLDTRFRLARMPFDFHALLHFDLLYPARVLWKLRWGSVRLGDLERSVLRYERPEDVPGELIPQLYFDYLRSGNEHPLRIVFQHNTADLVSLAALAARMLQLVSAPETSSKEPLEPRGSIPRLRSAQSQIRYWRPICRWRPRRFRRLPFLSREDQPKARLAHAAVTYEDDLGVAVVNRRVGPRGAEQRFVVQPPDADDRVLFTERR